MVIVEAEMGKFLILAAALLFACPLGGCLGPRLAGAPEPLFVPAGATNPDVIWIVREVSTERRGSKDDVLLWGLFACYRAEEPEAPQCFLAQIAGTKEHLVWPDNPKKYPGKW